MLICNAPGEKRNNGKLFVNKNWKLKSTPNLKDNHYQFIYYYFPTLRFYRPKTEVVKQV